MWIMEGEHIAHGCNRRRLDCNQPFGKVTQQLDCLYVLRRLLLLLVHSTLSRNARAKRAIRNRASLRQFKAQRGFHNAVREEALRSPRYTSIEAPPQHASEHRTDPHLPAVWRTHRTDRIACRSPGRRHRSKVQASAPCAADTFAQKERTLAGQQQALDQRARELEAAARKQQQEIAQAVQGQVQQKLVAERRTIAEQETVRARKDVEDQLTVERAAAREQAERNVALTQKLTAAQAVQTDLLKQKQQLEDRERELELDVQKGITAGLADVRSKAIAEAQAGLDLKVQDRDNTITQLRDQITSLQRKAEQGSHQAQGESLEIALEHQLRVQFPFDLIEPVGKGEHGGDVLQHIRDQSEQVCGKILWESKRTKAWSDSWLPKLKTDQRSAHADLAVIVSQTMPKDVTHFDQVDGIWVSSLGYILPVATALRVSVLELAGVRRANQGQESKAQLIYAYLTGPRFKHRIECIAEKFSSMREDLDRERKWMNKQMAKRDGELLSVLEATSGALRRPPSYRRPKPQGDRRARGTAAAGTHGGVGPSRSTQTARPSHSSSLRNAGAACASSGSLFFR